MAGVRAIIPTLFRRGKIYGTVDGGSKAKYNRRASRHRQLYAIRVIVKRNVKYGELALFPSGEAKTLRLSVKRRKSSGGLREEDVVYETRGERRGGKTRVAVRHPNNCACPRRGIIHLEASRFDHRFLSAVAYIYSYNGDSIGCRSNNPWEDSTRDRSLFWIRQIYMYVCISWIRLDLSWWIDLNLRVMLDV